MTSAAKVYLYCAIPREKENAPIVRSLAGRIARLCRLWTGAVLWRATGRFTLDAYDAAALSNSNRGDIAIREAVEELLAASLGRDTAFIHVGWDDLDEIRVAEINAEGALLVIAGSGYFMLDERGRVPARLSRDADLLSRIDVPVVAIAPGVNRNYERGVPAAVSAAPESAPVLHGIAERLALFSVRDRQSVALMQSAGAAGPRVVADPAFFLSPPEASAPPSGSTPSVGLNLAFHSHDMEPLLAGLLPEAVAALRTFQRERGCRYVCFVHSSEEAWIYRLLRLSGLDLRLVDAGPRAMLAEYARLDMHVCMMMHSSILAMNRAVPTLALAYDAKSDGLYDLLGLSAWTLPAAEAGAPDVLLDRMNALWTEREAVHAQIRARLVDLRADMDGLMTDVSRLLRQPTGRSESG